MSSSSAVTSSSPSSSSPSPDTHSCPYADCNKSFSKKYNLKAHLRLHTGEQPFECDRPDCRKKFKWRSSLSSHSVWHARKDNAASSATTVSKPTTTSKSNSQKTSTSRPARVPTQTPRPLSNSNSNSCSSASVSNLANRKKRPRSEMSACSMETVKSVQPQSSGTSSTSRVKAKSKATGAKKQRRTKTCDAGTTGASDDVSVGTENVLKQELEIYETTIVDNGGFDMMPGSPVTSDGSISEAALEADEFPCDILQPLLSRGDTLELDTDAEVLFGYEEAGCESLTGFDTRFEQLDLDNFGNLYLNRLESL